MLLKATNRDKDKILKAICGDIDNCLYLYIDISYYGIEYKYIDVWFDEDEEHNILAVIMKYHDNFQLYLKNGYKDFSDVIKLLKSYKPPMISGEKRMIQEVLKYMHDDYDLISGKIIRLDNSYGLNDDNDLIEEASEEDVYDIAELICNDVYYRNSYTVKELSEQLLDRMKSNMGKSWIIRDGNKIVAHDSITAQFGEICIGGMFIVDREYRGKTNYGFLMEDFIIKQINKENKRLYAFLTDNTRIKLLCMIGNKIVSEYGKLILCK